MAWPASADQAIDVPARAWLLADATTGDIVAGANIHQRMAPASTLKTLTSLALMPKLAPDDSYTATKDDLVVDGGTTGMQVGMTYTIRDLWHGLLLDSGNDTALGLAHAYSPITTETLNLMRAELARLGAQDTTIKNPHGLDAKGQVTSVYDMALIARAALNIPLFQRVTLAPTYQFPAKNGTFQIQNENKLLGKYKGVIGGKTGFTSDAGQTYWVAAQRGDVVLIAVMFDINGRMDRAARALLDWGFKYRTDLTPIGTLTDPRTPTITRTPALASNVEGAMPWSADINWTVFGIASPILLLSLLLIPVRKSGRDASTPVDHAEKV